jgi:hypothetical protein
MRLLTTFIFALFFIVGCAKEPQRTTNWLDGAWKVTNYTVDGQVLPESSFSAMAFDFTGCDILEYDYCDGVMKTNGGDDIDFKFTIGTDGNTFSINFIALDLEDISGTIESSKKKQVLTFSSNNKAQVITLEAL